jgi:hypothetical protein
MGVTRRCQRIVPNEIADKKRSGDGEQLRRNCRTITSERLYPTNQRSKHSMFMILGLCINAVVLMMVFGLYSKLDELLNAIRRLTPNNTTLPTTPSIPAP